MTTLKDDNFIGQRCQISCDSESMVEVDGKLIPEFFFPYDSNIFTCEDNEKNEAQWDRAIPSCVQYDIWKRGSYEDIYPVIEFNAQQNILFYWVWAGGGIVKPTISTTTTPTITAAPEWAVIPIDCDDTGHHYCDNVCHVNTRICDGILHCEDESDETSEQCQSNEGMDLKLRSLYHFKLRWAILSDFASKILNPISETYSL